MSKWENPKIHHVRRFTASAKTCRKGTDSEFTCLTISAHTDGAAPAEMEIYFNCPHNEIAHKYADAINSVRQ